MLKLAVSAEDFMISMDTPWLTALGSARVGCVVVSSWSQAGVVLLSAGHRSAYMDMANRSRRRHFERDGDQGEQHWDDNWAPTKALCESLVDRRLAESQAVIPVDMMKSVRGRLNWVILHAARECMYAFDTVDSHFQRACQLVREGRLPVGWEGALENGRFVIY